MKKALSFLLCALMVASCLTSFAMTASAEGTVLATLTADELATTGTGTNQVTITKNSEDGVDYASFTASGGDPYVYYNAKVADIAKSQFMKITYRTSGACTLGEYFLNSGSFFCLSYDYVNDGEWHTVVLDLTQNPQHTSALQVFRLDPFTGGNANGCTVDIQSIEFFSAEELTEEQYTLELTTNPFANGIPSVNIGEDVVLGGTLTIPAGAWTSWHYSINGSTWAPASYEAGENGAFENLVIPTNTLSGGVHTVALQARNDNYQCVTLNATIHMDISTIAVGEGTTGQLFNGGTGGSKFGVHINAYTGLYSFTVQSLANYGNSTDKMKVEAFVWNTDVATTTSARPAWSTELSGISDNADTTVDIPAGTLAGEIYLQFTPIDGQLTAKAADTSVNPDVEFFVDGNKVEGGFMGYYVAANPAQLIWDLTSGSEDIDFLPTADASLIKAAAGYIKAVATAEGAAITNVGANLNPAFKYVGIIYRTNTPDATLSVNNSEAVALATDGLWNVAYVDLDTAGLDAIADLAISFAGSIDVAYVGIYKSPALREASANAGVAATLNRTVKDETVYDTATDSLIDIGNMHSSSPVFVYDFSLYLTDPAATYGFANLTHMEMGEYDPANGYVTFKATEGDPYFTFGASPAGYANQLRYVVIKYRTTSQTNGEFFTGTSGGYGWANPMEKTHTNITYNNDGQWHTTVVDASAIWGDLYGQTLQNFRFDPLDSPTVAAGDSIDVSYIAFYSNLAAAEAAAAADEGVAPTAPVDPSTVEATVFDGEGLFTTMGVTDAAGIYNYQDGYMTLSCNGADPSFFLLHNANLTVGPILAIRYRTTSDLAHETHNECFIGKGELSGDDWLKFVSPIQNDGEWHTAYVNLIDVATAEGYPGKLQVNDDGTVSLDYFRFDFLRYPGSIDVAYVGFFKTVGEFEAFDAQVWTAPKFYKVTFMADDVAVKEVYYREGSQPTVPGVPAKEGFTGAWEEFELGKDVVVNAVYTEIPEDTTEDTTADPGTDPGDETTQDPGEGTTAPDGSDQETTAPDGSEEITTEPEEPKTGCKSALAAGAVLALASMIALGAACFKKKD